MFNALELMDNAPLFDDLLFKPGDGTLRYFLYNWRCTAWSQRHIGLIML